MASIYELTNDWNAVYSMIDDEEIDETVILDTLESIEGDIETKADGYAMVMTNANNVINGIDEEIKRLQNRKKVMQNRIDYMKKNLYECMKITGKLKFKTNKFSFNIAKNGGLRKLHILTNEIEKLPKEFRVKQPDKINDKAIREYLKENNIDRCEFAELEPQGESLRIK